MWPFSLSPSFRQNIHSLAQKTSRAEIQKSIQDMQAQELRDEKLKRYFVRETLTADVGIFRNRFININKVYTPEQSMLAA